MDAKRGEIVDYETEGDVFPMLVLHVNDQETAGKDARGEDVPNESYGTVVGLVFRTDGTSHVVNIPKESEPDHQDVSEPTPEPTQEERAADFRAQFAKLSPEERAALIGETPQTPATSEPVTPAPGPGVVGPSFVKPGE